MAITPLAAAETEALLQDLLQPAVLLQIAIGLTLLYLFVRRVAPRRRLVFLIVLFLVQMVLSTGAAGYFLNGSLEWQNPPTEERPDPAQRAETGSTSTAGLRFELRRGVNP